VDQEILVVLADLESELLRLLMWNSTTRTRDAKGC
jgi:hypothetical protein